MMQPTQPNERFEILDILRGFALTGVMIANMAYHSGYFFLSQDAKAAMPLADANHIVMWVIHFVTDGKFYSIFSILFGIGFGLQIQRAMDKGKRFAGRFSRRLLILFFIGVLHAFLFYVGDILTLYALIGFLLLLFRKTSDRWILRLVPVLLILPVAQYLIMWFPAQNNPAPVDLGDSMFDEVTGAYQSGTLGEIIYMNVGGTFFGRYPDIIFTGRVFKVLALFLLGFYVARNRLFANLQQRRQQIKRLALWTFIIGLPCNIALAQMMSSDAYYNMESMGWLQPVVYAFGVPGMGIFYACMIALMYTKTNLKPLVTVFAPMGRMALTNYLMQSVLSCFVFMSYGWGQTAKMGPIWFTLISIGVLIFQMVFSDLWLKKFQYGPMEWLWRSMTYGKIQSIKNKEPAYE